MDPPSGRDAAPDPVRFKAGKKRKAYRRRPDDDDDDDGSSRARAGPATEAPAGEPDAEEESALAATLRLRNARSRRLGGVGFASGTRADGDAGADHALVRRGQADDDVPAIKGIADRFTRQTGLIADLNDKYMYAALIVPRRAPRTTPEPALIIQGTSI